MNDGSMIKSQENGEALLVTASQILKNFEDKLFGYNQLFSSDEDRLEGIYSINLKKSIYLI